MMPPKTGIDTQFAYVAESTWGTAVTVTTFVPLVSESLQSNDPGVRSAGIIAGHLAYRSEQHNGGLVEAGGGLQLELTTLNCRTLMEHAMGLSTGAGPYTLTPADLGGKGLTMQVGKPGIGGTVHPFTFEGCKINTWEIAGTAGEIVTLGLDVIAEQRRTATALAATSYTATRPYKMVNSTITFNAITYPVKSFKIRGDNKLSRRPVAGSAYTAEPLHGGPGPRMYGGEVVIDFTDLVEITASDAHDEDAFSFTVASGGYSWVIAGNCTRVGGIDPAVSGTGILQQTIPFECIATSATMSTAISIVIDETA